MGELLAQAGFGRNGGRAMEGTAGRRKRTSGGEIGLAGGCAGGWEDYEVGGIPFPVEMAARGKTAEAALLAIDPLEQEEQQEVTAECAKSEEDCERHGGYHCLQEKSRRDW